MFPEFFEIFRRYVNMFFEKGSCAVRCVFDDAVGCVLEFFSFDGPSSTKDVFQMRQKYLRPCFC